MEQAAAVGNHWHVGLKNLNGLKSLSFDPQAKVYKYILHRESRDQNPVTMPEKYSHVWVKPDWGRATAWQYPWRWLLGWA